MKRKKGIILGITLMMFLVIAILGTSIMAIVMSKARQTNDLEKRTQAYFFARSGVEIAIQYLIDKTSENDSQNKIWILHGNLPAPGGNSDFSISEKTREGEWYSNVRNALEEFRNNEGKGEEVVTAVWQEVEKLNILSIGTASDVTRVVSYMGRYTIPDTVFPFALYTTGTIDVGGASTIIGKIGTTDINNVSDKIPKENVIVVEEGMNYEYPEFKESPFDETSPVTINPAVISSDGYYKGITGSITIATDPDSVSAMKVGIDNLSNVSSIVIDGPGKVELYVDDLLNPEGSINWTENNLGDPGKLSIYYHHKITNDKEGIVVDLSTFQMSGTLFIKLSDSREGKNLKEPEITFGNSADSSFLLNGLMVVEGAYDITANGGQHGDNEATLIYAPDSDVELVGNPEFYGGLVAKTFDSGGNTLLSRIIDSAENPIGIIIDKMSSELWGE
jgi:hypothetical protein